MRAVALILGISMLLIFIIKLLSQRSKGINTIVMGKGRKTKPKLFEIILSGIMILSILLILTNIILDISAMPFTAKIVGAVMCFIADVILAVAVICMSDSWRAGIPENEETKLITGGIYRISRNPAFLAFDLMFLGMLMMFFSLPLAVVVAATAIALHFQILNEEKYLSAKFGEEYKSYKSSVGRYFIF